MLFTEDTQMRLLVTGGRDFNDIDFIVNRLSTLHQFRPITHLIHGGARGVDTICGVWADEVGIPFNVVRADWSQGKGAGFRRNQTMLNEYHPDALLAFPGGTGTADMVTRATKVLQEIWQIERLYFAGKGNEADAFLSNYSIDHPFFDEMNREWATVEHYYQAKKTSVLEDQEMIRQCSTPGQAKRKGNKDIAVTYDWRHRKMFVMRQAIAFKFSLGSEAAELLDDTRWDYLIEYAPWGDTFWGGDSTHNGENRLGKLLMERRELNRKQN
jgi:ribA/ribD-fused uncharacterized protein